MNNYSIETKQMLIKFYNMQAGKSFKYNDKNQDLVEEALARVNGDIVALKNHIRNYVNNNPSVNTNYDFINCFRTAGMAQAEGSVSTQAVTDQSVQSSLGILEQAVVQMISNMKADEIKNNIMGSVQEAVQDFIKSEYGVIERKIKVTLDTGKSKEFKGVVHDKFDTVLKIQI